MNPETLQEPEFGAGVLRWLRQILFFVILVMLGLFLSAGRLDWMNGWLFVVGFVTVFGPLAIWVVAGLDACFGRASGDRQGCQR